MTKRKIFPSFLTSMNLLCGFLAILINQPEVSFYLILIAIAFDFVDGLSARILKVQSLFGKELDSLADMVSFGVVPGFLYYHHVLNPSGSLEMAQWPNMLVATIVPVCAGLRLAKFNVNDSGKIGFAGLPSSAAALFIISIPFLVNLSNDLTLIAIEVPSVQQVIPILFSLLMVTDVPMFNFKSMKNGINANGVQLFYVATLIPIGITLGWLALPVSILWYILLSVLTIKVWRK